MDWVAAQQLLVDYGDWRIYNPSGVSGGWAFEYDNSWYPDVDDTAAVVLALLKENPKRLTSMTVERALDWLLSMQNKDGGWAAFDVDNDRIYLNEIPFSDMDSLCDTSSRMLRDVCSSRLGITSLLTELEKSNDENIQHRIRKIEAATARGIDYLRNSQEQEGSWFGRWGVNYIYGTSHALMVWQRSRSSFD